MITLSPDYQNDARAPKVVSMGHSNIRVSVKGEKAREVIDRCILLWEHNFPDEVKAFDEHMNEKLKSDSADHFTRNRQYRHMGEIPRTLHNHFVAALGKDYLRDHFLRELVFKRFKRGYLPPRGQRMFTMPDNPIAKNGETT